MSGELGLNESELHAFIDGALDAARAHAFEVKLAADPALAARVAAFRADKEMLKRVYAPLIARPIPEKWLALAHGSKPPARAALSWRMVGSIAAAILLLVAGVAAYRSVRPPQSGEIVQAALDARTHAMPSKIIAIEMGADAQRYDAALSKAVASSVKVPDLGRLGYQLAAIRLYPGAQNGGAAELLYRDSKARLFTLYVRRSNGAARFDQFERNGLRVCVWQDEELSTVMAGNVSTAAMQRLASLAYTGLTL
jgi:anti-sigma factor RsiW